MKAIVLTTVLLLVLPVEGLAQAGYGCEPRGAVGVAGGLLTLDFEMDPTLAGSDRFGPAATTIGTGVEAAVNATVPLAPEWSLAAELGSGRMAVAQTRSTANAFIKTRTGDSVIVRRLQAGLNRHSARQFLCSYVGVSLGVYQYSYRGSTLNAGALAATMGTEWPQTGSGALFFELGISVALTKLRAPTAAELAVNVRPAIGWRYRF